MCLGHSFAAADGRTASTSDVPDATVAELVDLARAMGIRRFALATIPSDQAR
jgi:hypothetical protein